MEYPQRQIDHMFREITGETVDLSDDTLTDQTAHPMYGFLIRKGYSEDDIMNMFALGEE